MPTDPDCLFCRIAAGQVQADVVARSDGALAFRDINPKAPTHVLVIPTDHVASLAEVPDDGGAMLAELVALANRVAREAGVGDGYRVVTNTGRSAGQSVPHLHLHVLGGRAMAWPPG
jgi:histidine triad (HIT) family protein